MGGEALKKNPDLVTEWQQKNINCKDFHGEPEAARGHGPPHLCMAGLFSGEFSGVPSLWGRENDARQPRGASVERGVHALLGLREGLLEPGDLAEGGGPVVIMELPRTPEVATVGLLGDRGDFLGHGLIGEER